MPRLWVPRNDLSRQSTPPGLARLPQRTWRRRETESPSDQVVVQKKSRRAGEDGQKALKKEQAHHPLFPPIEKPIDRQQFFPINDFGPDFVADPDLYTPELPPELWDLVYSFGLQQSFAIRSLPMPGMTTIQFNAREFWLRNNTFCLSTESMAVFQKRKRLMMRRVPPKPCQMSLDLVNHLPDSDIKEIKRVAFLVGGYENPNAGRFWLTVVHFKDGLEDFEVAESKDLEGSEDGSFQEEIVFQFVDWGKVPQVEDVLRELVKEGEMELSKAVLRRVLESLLRREECLRSMRVVPRHLQPVKPSIGTGREAERSPGVLQVERTDYSGVDAGF